MIAALRASRPTRPLPWRRAAPATRRGLPALLLLLAAASAATVSGAAVGAPVAPTPLGATASATPEVQPSATPLPLVFAAPPAGSTAPATARGEGRVAAGRAVTFVLRSDKAGLFSIGVSSPQNAARLSIFLGDSTRAASGTAVADGAIRWSSELVVGESVKVVVHTAGAEIPFRVEVVGGPGGV